MRKLIFILLIFALKASSLNAQQETQKIKVTKAKPSVAVELLKMNVLYVGVDNPVNIAVTNTNNFTVVMAKGTIEKNEDFFIIKEKAQGVDTLFIYDAKNNLIDKRLFRVKNVPNPVACIGSYCGNTTIAKNELLAQKGLIVVLPNFDFDIFFRIKNFQMTVLKNDNQIEMLESSNNLFTDDMKKLIETLPLGTRITFEHINAVGPDSQVRRLNPLDIVLK